MAQTHCSDQHTHSLSLKLGVEKGCILSCVRSLRTLLLIGNNFAAKGGWKYFSQDKQVSRTTCHAQPSGPKSLHRQGPAPASHPRPSSLLWTVFRVQNVLFPLCKKKLQGHKLRGLNRQKFSSTTGSWTHFKSRALSVRQSRPRR